MLDLPFGLILEEIVIYKLFENKKYCVFINYKMYNLRKLMNAKASGGST